MDWFRAYHGTCTDPKLHRIARSIHVSRGLVVAGWLAVLETASANDERGNIGEIDAVSLAFMIDVKPHVGTRILDAFRAAGMLDEAGNVTAWTKRQRQSDDAGVRKRKFREREADALCRAGDDGDLSFEQHGSLREIGASCLSGPMLRVFDRLRQRTNLMPKAGFK